MATLTIDDHRKEMLSLLEAGSAYRFLTLAEPYLRRCAADDEVRVYAVREYLKLKLVGPARDLLDVDESDTTLSPELRSVRVSLQDLAGGVVDWGECSGRFEANLSALAARGFDVGSIREAWRTGRGSLQLFRDANGHEQVRIRNGEGLWDWFPMVGDHRAVARATPIPPDLETGMPLPVLFDGLGLGHFFERVFQATKDTFLDFSCALFVVEPDESLAALVLNLRDWQTMLTDPRVLIFTGDDWQDRLEQAWDEDLDLPIPARVLGMSRPRPSQARLALDVVNEFAAARQKAIERSWADVQSRYAERDASYWAKRFDEAIFGGGEPLRILSAVSMHTTFLKYSMRDARQALEALGHRIVVLTERTAYGCTGPLTFHNAIRELDPDVFLMIDHLRPEFANIVPTNLPILTWDQDQLPHVFTHENLRRIAKHDFIVGCSKSRFVAMGFDPDQYLHAHVPTCPEQFSGAPLSDEEIERYTCDVSYVSHASQTPEAFHAEERGRSGDAGMRRLLDAMYERMPEMLARCRVPTGSGCLALFDEACRATGVDVADQAVRDHLLGWYLWRLGDRMFRHEALEWVARWARRRERTLRIYGNGWQHHPTLSEFAAGPAQNGRELLCIHRACRINLQLMPAGFIHQRALDGLASGGFFLSRFVPADLMGRTIRRLHDRMAELGIANEAQLLDHNDEGVRALLATYMKEVVGPGARTINDLVQGVRLLAELRFPDELFPRFREIVFDTEEEFVQTVDRFISDDPARAELAEEMRAVVVDRLSYQPTMDRFIKSMARYLRRAAKD
ncbi:MAG: hypothetical protein IID36_13650 [Planctomycetes bacterium]|nr:hypothetical protein [Planctomycetota bacterium]